MTYEVAVDAAGDKYVGLSSLDPNCRNHKTVRFEGEFWDKFGLSLYDPIHLKELWAILIAVKIAPTNCNLRVCSDNQTCIFAIPKGGGFTDSRQQSMCKYLMTMLSKKNVQLSVVYVQSAVNPADLPSRVLTNVIVPRRRLHKFDSPIREAVEPFSTQELTDYWFSRRNIELPQENRRWWQERLLAGHKDF